MRVPRITFKTGYLHGFYMSAIGLGALQQCDMSKFAACLEWSRDVAEHGQVRLHLVLFLPARYQARFLKECGIDQVSHL